MLWRVCSTKAVVRFAYRSTFTKRCDARHGKFAQTTLSSTHHRVHAMTLVWRQLLRVVASTHTASTPLNFGTALYVCLACIQQQCVFRLCSYYLQLTPARLPIPHSTRRAYRCSSQNSMSPPITPVYSSRRSVGQCVYTVCMYVYIRDARHQSPTGLHPRACPQ